MKAKIWYKKCSATPEMRAGEGGSIETRVVNLKETVSIRMEQK